MLSNPENKISQKKVIIVIFAFGVFFLGYFLAPPTMNDGYYEGNVTYRRDNASIEVDFLFILNSSIDVPKCY